MFSRSDLGNVGEGYDIVGVAGNVAPNDLPRKWGRVLAFQPLTKLEEAKKLLRRVDSAILCEGSEALVAYHFFESLLIPSLLNIDLADVKNMARGIGLSFHVSGGDGDEVTSKLPGKSYLAKSALLHFSCSEDVTLKEVYQISATLAKDDQRGIRKINIKIGLRVDNSGAERIRMTAILFGL
ncbi:MAG: hypothetical protein ACYC7D_09585 [Nitrososphaerales archaeon]